MSRPPLSAARASTARRRWAIAVLVAAVAGCASVPRPQPPQVVGATVRLAEVRLPDVRLVVDVALHNPNARDIALEALDAALALGGVDVGRATLERAVTLPAGGDAHVPLDVRGNAAAILAQLGGALGGGRAVDYELRGTLRLADGTTLPFRRRGLVPQARTP
jgi:LEA14-like dessication related protein